MKNRGKNKSVAFKIFAYTFVHCVYIYIYYDGVLVPHKKKKKNLRLRD